MWKPSALDGSESGAAPYFLTFDDGSALDVMLRDVSPVGARVISDGLGCLPRAFELQILEADGVRIASARRARLVWTDGRTAGLEFIT